MARKVAIVLCSASVVALSSCSLAERGNHAIRRVWVDYNSLRACALYLEQDDHLPYTAPKVGYYRWMYDKDPGHQLACLGAIPPVPDDKRNAPPMPEDDQPMGYQVLFPSALPHETDHLWGSKLPEPINVPLGPGISEAPAPPGGALPAIRSPGSSPPPILPPSPSSVNEPPPPVRRSPPGPAGSASPPAPPVPQAPVKPAPAIPGPVIPGPPFKPVDDKVPSAQGPAFPGEENVRLTTGQSARSISAPAY